MTSDDPAPTDSQSGAEQLDPSKLGEGPGDDERAADQGYPPESPMGVDDPALDPSEGDVAPDDVEQRSWREEPEPAAGSETTKESGA